MSVQKNYGYSIDKGIAGGIYDSYHYPIETRWNEEENGALRFGVGVVRGSIEGTNVVLPTAESAPLDFEGVVINGFDRQMDLEGKVTILNKQNIGVMKRGKVWVRLAEDAEPTYGDEIHLITSGDEAGCFATEGGIKIEGRFIGGADNGLAPIELYGTDTSDEAAAPAAPPVG